MKASIEILMVDPEFFDIKYAINPHMRGPDGELKKIDRNRARLQWKNLADVFKKNGFEVSILKGDSSLPDMVFSANQSLVFNDLKSGRRTALMSRMRASQRQPEVALFEKWYREQGFEVEHLNPGSYCFEGAGDGIFHPGKPLLWGGYGPRSDKEVYSELQKRFGFEVQTLELVHGDLYHLDTCFFVIDEKTVAVCKEAFSNEGFNRIRQGFSDVIEIDLKESLQGFAANAFCPNGRDVFIQSGCTKLVAQLEKRGLHIHEVETGEFIKAGGSVFCLKMYLPTS